LTMLGGKPDGNNMPEANKPEAAKSSVAANAPEEDDDLPF
jgi:hypothetical protein